ncbi:MAG: recombination mediator RecR [Patescibacteria group bacterium]|jgi:recombination protein RecR
MRYATMKYPKSIENLIRHFSTLPTVGPKTAERYVFYLLSRPAEELKIFGEAVAGLKSNISACPGCLTLVENGGCLVCSDAKRDPGQLCIVADPRDLAAIESTKNFKGYYLVLGGEINAIEGVRPDSLNINELLKKLKSGRVKETILGLNPTLEGETTAMYLSRLIKNSFPYVKITRLARGLPMGADIEYADEMTLSNSLKYRSEI